jgi:Ser/Thr protein kinase RdoA (MazF antagonist)
MSRAMGREEIVEICERDVLAAAARLFGTTKDQLSKFDDYEGCANLAYRYERGDQGRVLRISSRPDRPEQQVEAELHPVSYLAKGGVRVPDNGYRYREGISPIGG